MLRWPYMKKLTILSFLCFMLSWVYVSAQLSSPAICKDSNTLIRYYSDELFQKSKILLVNDGGNVTWGGILDGYNSYNNISIFRTTPDGSIKWSTQLLPETHLNFPDINIVEGVNGTILVSGLAKYGLNNQPQFFFIACIGNDGALLWYHFYDAHMNNGQQSVRVGIGAAAVDVSGNMYVPVNFTRLLADRPPVSIVCKFSPAGLPIWNKAFVFPLTQSGAVFFLGCFERNDTLTLLSHTGTLTPFVTMQLRSVSGSMLNVKAFEPIGNVVFPNASDIFRTKEDKYVMMGGRSGGSGDFSGIDFNTVIFNRQLEPIKSFHIKTFQVYTANGWGGYGKNMVTTPDGELLYGTARPQESSFYYGQIDTAFNIKTQKKIQYTDPAAGNFYLPPLSYCNGNKLSIRSTGCSPITGKCGLDYLSFDKDIVKTNDCFSSMDTSFMELIPFKMNVIPFTWDYIEDNVLKELPILITQQSAGFSMEEVCKEINICEKPVISGPDSICVSQAETFFTVPENDKCYKNIYWTIDERAIRSRRQVNDNTIALAFKTEWQGHLYASINGSCILQDSLLITAYKEKAGKLLTDDTSICEGSWVKLDIPGIFLSYSWNTGAATSYIQVTKKGIYSVKVLESDGCFIKDTFHLQEVFAALSVNLSNNPVLCDGFQILDAGEGFTSYLWQDGSNNRTFAANTPGKYWVSTMDVNGCMDSDTASFTRLAEAPKNFIADTAFCAYEYLLLKPDNNRYRQYLWNDGSISNTLTVTKPGIYWLQVIDNNGCTGRDSAMVKMSICPQRFFVPNSFTPNGDGKNDVFKPVVTGALQTYQFSIYNRWGQPVFKTSSRENSWNGLSNNKKQPSGNYIWVCTYQFYNQPPQIRKGTVMLLP